MEIPFRVGVVAHEKRAEQAEWLKHEVRADYVSLDDGTRGCDGNHKHVLAELANTGSRWAIVLEDDAVPVNNFRWHVEPVVALAPARILSFYLGQLRPPQHQTKIRNAIAAADDIDAHWIVSPHLYHAVAYAIRTDLIPSVLDWHSRWPIDQHISEWAQRRGEDIGYCWPSLVDHADGDTLFTHPDNQPRPKGRIAHRVGTRPHWTIRTVRTAP